MKPETKQLQIRLPHDAKSWIEEQAAANASSQNSEVVRSIRERMEREAKYREYHNSVRPIGAETKSIGENQ